MIATHGYRGFDAFRHCGGKCGNLRGLGDVDADASAVTTATASGSALRSIALGVAVWGITRLLDGWISGRSKT